MLGNTQLLSCCIMFHVSQGKIQPIISHMHPYEYKHMHTYAYSAKHGHAVSHTHPQSHSRLFVFYLSSPTWTVAWPANHNICHVAVTTVLALHSAKSVHIELTGFSCSEGMSTQECTNQSYFTSSTLRLNYNLPSSSLSPTVPSSIAFSVSLEHIARETLNESDKLFTWTIMSRFWLRGTTISSFHWGTWATVTTIMNCTKGISVKYTVIKRSVLHQTCIGRSVWQMHTLFYVINLTNLMLTVLRM